MNFYILLLKYHLYLLILQPTRITNNSNTFADSTFSNVIDPGLMLSNLTTIISDHLAQFAIPMFDNISGNKCNIYQRNWSKFDHKKIILDYTLVYWEDLLKTDELITDNSTKLYLDKINTLWDTYVPLKRIKTSCLCWKLINYTLTIQPNCI